jgi:hypothetical protein
MMKIGLRDDREDERIMNNDMDDMMTFGDVGKFFGNDKGTLRRCQGTHKGVLSNFKVTSKDIG